MARKISQLPSAIAPVGPEFIELVQAGSSVKATLASLPVSAAVAAALVNKADLVSGLIPTSQLPALAINDTFTVSSQAAMLALTAQRGDVAIRTDITSTFILAADNPTQLVNWKQMSSPSAVTSVNGQIGVIVLGAGDVGAQPVDSDLTAIAALTTNAFGRGLLTLSSDAAVRSYIGAALASSTIAGYGITDAITRDANGVVLTPAFVYFAGKFAYAADDHIDFHLAKNESTGPLSNQSIYSILTHSGGGTYVRDSNCWLRGDSSNGLVDLTPIAVYNSWDVNRGIILISPRHFISYGNSIPPNGTIVRFVTNTNTTVSRTVSASLFISIGLGVGKLDSDVPNTIAFAKVLPASVSLKSQIGRALAFVTMTDQKVWTADQGNPNLTNGLTIVGKSAYLKRSLGYKTIGYPVTSDDAGAPYLYVFDRELVFAGTANEDIDSFWSASFKHDQINAAMTSLGGGYQLTDYTSTVLPPRPPVEIPFIHGLANPYGGTSVMIGVNATDPSGNAVLDVTNYTLGRYAGPVMEWSGDAFNFSSTPKIGNDPLDVALGLSNYAYNDLSNLTEPDAQNNIGLSDLSGVSDPDSARANLGLGSAATSNVSDVAYNATSWDGNLDVPTKNAIRDKFETLAGGGTVTNFSAGDLSPLFTTAEATTTTTPALTFSLSNAGAHTFFGNETGSSAAPHYVQPAFTDISGRATSSQLPLGAQLFDNAGTPKLALDLNVRKAYGTNGTSPLFWWNNTFGLYSTNVTAIAASETGAYTRMGSTSIQSVAADGVSRLDLGAGVGADGIALLGQTIDAEQIFFVDPTSGATRIGSGHSEDGDGILDLYRANVAGIGRLTPDLLTALRTQHLPNADGTLALTGNASGVVDIAHGGTNATTASAARTNLGATTVGANLFTVADPSAVRYIRIDAANSVTLRTASQQLGDLGGEPALGNPGSDGYVLASTAAGVRSWVAQTAGGDASTNTSTSVDSELAIFSGTGGKTLKRATGSGIVKLASGVLGFGATTSDLSEGSNLYYTDVRVRLNRLDQLAAPTASVSFGSQRITNLADPSGAQDAATKAYVDATTQGLSIKTSAVYATTTALPANIYNNGSSGVGATLTGVSVGALTMDGSTPAIGDRVVVKDEATAANNGIYVVTTVGSGIAVYVLTRAADMNQTGEIAGAFVFVEGGTVNAGSGFVVIGTGTYTVGTTAINWTQFSGAGEITAGAALTKTGNTLDVGVDGSTIEVSADALRVKDAGISLAKMANLAANSIIGNNTGSAAAPLALTASQVKTLLSLDNVENTALSTWAGSANITTLGTIGTGTWNGGVIAGLYGGTGVANSGKTITLANNLVTSGNFALTLTQTATTNVTLPTTGTLATLAGSESFTNKNLSGAGNTFPTFNQNTTGSAASLSVSGQTGLLTVTGLTSTNRAKTVRDAADTILELGGSYTPTGTWTNMVLATPALGTPSALVLTNATGSPTGISLTKAQLNTIVSDDDPAYVGTANAFTAQQTNSYTSIASTPAMLYSGTVFTGGSATTTKPHFLIEPAGTTSTAWNTSGTQIGVNAVSGFAGKFLDLQVAATSKLNIAADGTVTSASGSFAFIASSGGMSVHRDSSYKIGNFTLMNDSDAGLQINNGTRGRWSLLKLGSYGATTNAVVDGAIIGTRSSATPAAGLGAGILFNIDSSTTADQNAARVAALWTDATHATRTADLVFYTVNSAAALAETARMKANGDFYVSGKIELGAASDTTISRVAAGQIAVEGVNISTISSTDTLTNKRITRRTGTTTSSATPTINTDNVDFYSITALAAAITSFTTNLSGTPTEAQTLWIAITDNGTARAITWGTSFEASGTVALPTTTVISTRLDVGFVWNTVTSKWRCVAVA